MEERGKDTEEDCDRGGREEKGEGEARDQIRKGSRGQVSENMLKKMVKEEEDGEEGINERTKYYGKGHEWKREETKQENIL